jgi:SAM-dependent methyltransferase
MILSGENSPGVKKLRERMDAFYATYQSYPVFQKPTQRLDEWNHVKKAIGEIVTARGRCRVLEFGAGQSGFSDFLGDLRRSVELTVQDVTPVNEAYLAARADHLHIGSIMEISGDFEVIFSTFVLEHVSEPRATLEKLVGLLSPGGSLFVFCPRYDFPFYISHSADHYGRVKRFLLGMQVMARRLRSLLTRRPAFLIHLDPAMLHMEWRMDRDAIHWASLTDLRLFFRKRGTVRKLPIHAGAWKDWVVKNLLRINIRFVKSDA